MEGSDFMGSNMNGNGHNENNKHDEFNEDLQAQHFKEVETRRLELKADAIKIEGTEDYANVFLSLLKAEAKKLQGDKHYWVMGLDEDGYILCVYIFSVNPEHLMKISPKAIFKTALFVEATNLIVAYNVQKGENLIPRGLNVDFFNKVFNAAADFEMKVVDTMVISEEGYHSDREDGYLKYYKEDELFKLVYNVKDILDKQKKKYAQKQVLKIVKSMLKNGESIDTIMIYTGLSVEKIEALRDDISNFGDIHDS